MSSRHARADASRPTVGSYFASVVAVYALVLFVHFALIVLVLGAAIAFSEPLSFMAIVVAGWGAGLAGAWFTFLSLPGWTLHAIAIAALVRYGRAPASRRSSWPEVGAGFALGVVMIFLGFALFRKTGPIESTDLWKTAGIAFAEGLLGAVAAAWLSRRARPQRASAR